ncbi:MAG: sensor histidine kinase, partial [Halosimplex sp.]
MDDRIVILDDDDRIVDVNPAAADLVDVDPDAVVGSPLDAVAPELAAAVGSLDAGKTELELEGVDGRHFYDVRVSSLYRSYGGVAGRVVSFRDVTDRRRHEQRLDVLNRVLRHNLRNELNVVRGNAELLRRDLDASTERADERIDRIEETVDAVSERSEKIGQISREIDDQTDGTFDAATRLENLAETIESRYPTVTVEVRLPDELTVSGGPPLERAFEELFENAAEHGGETPTIRVTAERRDDDFAAVRVADDGPGIERQERVVIEEERETALEHGSGVGLWLVNWVVRECGGDIAFAGAAEGTTVVVTLPEADAPGSTGGESKPGDGEPDGERGALAEVEAGD